MLQLKFQRQLAHFALDVDLECRYPVTAVFGPSGAGKTSLLNLVAGLLCPDAGEIAVDDTTLFSAAQRIDLAWMVSYRAAHPLDVTTLSDEDLTAYLAELVLMIPGAHRWGFKVVSMERRQRRIRLRFKTPHDMAIGEMVLEQSVRFDLNGAVESWSHLQRKWVSERP